MELGMKGDVAVVTWRRQWHWLGLRPKLVARGMQRRVMGLVA